MQALTYSFPSSEEESPWGETSPDDVPSWDEDDADITEETIREGYPVNTAKIIEECGGNKEEAAKRLSFMAAEGNLGFPYHRLFLPPADNLFNNISRCSPRLSDNYYRLYSYYPENGLYLPPRFRGKALIIASKRGDYLSTDALSDIFNEEVRLHAKRYDQNHSIWETWKNPILSRAIMRESLDYPLIKPQILRDVIYRQIAETNIFRPTWAKALIYSTMGCHVKGKRWLDISAGWGDRLLTAMALDMNYTGYDPNIGLIQGHQAMISQFGNPERHRVIPEPFEKGTLEGNYDIILTSPPYFTVEEYAADQPGQSIVEYPEFNQWMVKFLFASIKKAWKSLVPKGYMILHVGDTRTVKIAEPLNLFIEEYLPGASWVGTIGVQSEGGHPRPVWVWRKIVDSEVVRWNPDVSRSFRLLYPALHQLFSDFLGASNA